MNEIDKSFARLDRLLCDMEKGIPLESSPEIDRLCKLVIEKTDTRTEDEIIADGVSFIMDARLGGP